VTARAVEASCNPLGRWPRMDSRQFWLGIRRKTRKNNPNPDQEVAFGR